MKPRRVTRDTVVSPRLKEPLTLAVVADLHNGDFDDVLPVLHTVDAIVVVGDLVNRHRKGFEQAARFLREAPLCAPTFYAIGNHERKFKEREAYWPLVERSQVRVLDNDFTDFRGIRLGALSSAKKRDVQTDFLADMVQTDAFRLLLCHHPEMYRRYVRGTAIDLTLAGHAHGGQIQLAGRGLYAPGQGILPRLTHGFYDDGRLLVSRGMTNSSGAPRWNNPCEMLLLHLAPGENESYQEE